jgi:xanthine dehydrogenase accessory factor
MMNRSPGGPVHWLDQLAACPHACIAVAVARVEGSTPREAGSRMLVTADGLQGTIGGGQLEWRATGLARELLASGPAAGAAIRRFALGPALGQCCGGAATLVLERIEVPHPDWIGEACARRTAGEVLVLVTPLEPLAAGQVAPRLIGRRQAGCVAAIDAAPAALRATVRHLLEDEATGACVVEARGLPPLLLERIAPPAFEVTVFGAGHVGQALVAALAWLPCQVNWVDERAGAFPPSLPRTVNTLDCASALDVVDHMHPGGFAVVLTHSHALDQDLCERLLRRGDLAFVGLIGSATKRATFERRLLQRGLDPAVLARLVCPIGIAGISGKEPAVIAASVVAQLLQVHEGRRVCLQPHGPVPIAPASCRGRSDIEFLGESGS